MRVALFMLIVSSSLGACGSELEGHAPAGIDARDDSDTGAASDIADATEVEFDETADASEEVDADEVDASDADTQDATDVSDATDAGDVSDATDVPDVSDTLDADVPLPWRSKLYPEDWQPGLKDPSGAQLQDYSYAGYHNGERELGAGLGPAGIASLSRFDVTSFGAIASPTTAGSVPTSDSGPAFQDAIDAAKAAGGGVVFVPAGLYRIDTWLTVASSRVVIQGEGPAVSRLWFTRKLGLSYSSHIRFAGSETISAEAPLVADATRFDRAVAVADAADFNIGEDIVVGQLITDAFLAEHGMTELWSNYKGEWQPLYRRTIVGIDRTSEPNLVRLDVPLRDGLEVASGATVRRVSGLVREVGLADIGIANATDWATAWGGDQISAIGFDFVADGWVENVASFVSPGAPKSGKGMGAHLQSGGILVASSKRVTISDCHLEKPENRGGNGNGYLFEVRQSSEILTRDCSGREGRTNFIQSRGFGTSGCVWLRVHAADGAYVPLGPIDDTALPARNEMHTLGTANLVDSSTFEDGFDALNRNAISRGSGHSATECVFWNFAGQELISLQYGLGYIIGSTRGSDLLTSLRLTGGAATEPEDWVEGAGTAEFLVPSSLFEDQLARRLGGR